MKNCGLITVRSRNRYSNGPTTPKPVQIIDLSNDALKQLLLYGDQDLSYDLNENILELTLRFIHETGRFD